MLAHNFTTLTDEVNVCRQALRSIPEHAQQLHPTFTAALLFLDTPNPAVAPSTLTHITNLWLESLKKRLPGKGPSESDPIYLALLGQAMVATRVTGQLEASVKFMQDFERRFAWRPEETVTSDLDENSIMLTKSPLNGSLPSLFREAAATALAAGDIAHARRLLHQLQKHSEERISAPFQSFGHASTRTVTDRQSGTRWFLAALSELAFVELVHGDMLRCAALISEIDATSTKSGETAPGISWVGAEIARAHLSFEHFDPSLYEHASSKLAPIRDRFEQWPLLLMAEAALLRNERGAESALAHLRSGISAANEAAHEPNRWLEFLTKFHVMLCTTSGDLSQAERLLNASTNTTPIIRIERARLSLFSGDDIGALLMSRDIGDPETTLRQQLDQHLIVAVAAWGCGRHDEAFAALADANEYLTAYGLRSMLQGVPYNTLREVAVAARQSGVCDLTELIDAIPKPGRCVRYERLTEGEIQALTAIYEHRNAVQAAASLFVTPGTVKKHLASVYRKLQVSSRDEAIFQATRMGLLPCNTRASA